MFTIMLAFTALVALGHHSGFLNNLLFKHLPLYNRFRAPSMILGLTVGILAWSIPVGFQLFNKSTLLNMVSGKRFKVAVTATAVLLLCMSTFAPALFSLSWDLAQVKTEGGKDEQFEQLMIDLGNSPEVAAGFMEALRADRARLIRIDAVRALFFMVLVLGLMFLFYKQKIRTEHLPLVALSLVFIDLWSVNRNYLNSEDFTKAQTFAEAVPPTAADRSIDNLRSAYDRVLDLNTSNWIDARPSYYHLNIGGNHAAKLRRYQDLIEYHLNDEIASINSGKQNISVPALNMLNTRFVKTGSGPKDYLQNLTAMGFAWFVDSIAWVETAEEEIRLINSLQRAEFAIVHEEFKPVLRNIPNGKSAFSMIELRYKEPGKVVYKVAVDKPRLLVMSEIIYRPNTYWKSYIDGIPVDHVRANYVLRAIPVGTGVHEVTFEFAALPFHKGEPISAAGSGIWLLIVVISVTGTLKNPYSSTDTSK